MMKIPMTYCPKSSANPITVTPIWKQEFANGEHPIRGLSRFFLQIFFSYFRSHIKDSKWGKKCINMNCASRNGSPQQIPLGQLPFANEAKPHFRCRAFLAKSTMHSIRSAWYRKLFSTSRSYRVRGFQIYTTN